MRQFDETLKPYQWFKTNTLTILEQNKINALYTMTGKGDSGAGIIREEEAKDIKGKVKGKSQRERRSIILATVSGGPSFQGRKKGFSPDVCENQVSKLTPLQLDWIKTKEKQCYNKGIL